VTAETVAKALSEKTEIPVGQIAEDQDREKRERVLRMAAELKARVIGQDEACDKVAQAVQRALSGLKVAERPLGVFLFLGTTGVGKTELAKATADFLSSVLGTGKALVRLDMSEYSDRHAVSRLLGAPPGYVGHEEEGQLTGALRRAPYSVVLLDEIEKAHPDVHNLFLQLFDEGRLTDTHGRTANASHTLFIMTSNIAAKSIKGFAQPDEQARRESLSKELIQQFSPEFLNRLDDVIVFNALTPEHMKRIARLLLGDLERRLTALNMSLEVSEEALAWLSRKGCGETYGARLLRRAIERHLENSIAGKILREEVRAGHTIIVDTEADDLTFQLKITQPSPEADAASLPDK
jgi:ATP-dependent Clp protease ATP-binding subunit ClpA